ncbi:MAG: cell division ATP-binding protein FtsE [Gammaproteobacteria bacterium]|jgi:cell division transport system ATP-binding protein|nr:cell division ATP-binding protein FtsE [Gammaproteobacteria bacterium]
MIQLQQVSKRYADKTALDHASLHMPRGAMAFLTGHSGAGKSTLLKLIMLMEQPSAGRVIIDQQDLSKLRGKQIALHRRKIGLVFQNHQLLEDYNVHDNIALPLKVSGYNNRDAGRRVRAALDKVGLLSKEKLLPQVLSTGEQQRIGIARAIVNKPRLILADEPTGNLDPKLSAEIMQLFEQFNQVGVTVLVASHDLSLIERLSHPIIHLYQGHISGAYAGGN